MGRIVHAVWRPVGPIVVCDEPAEGAEVGLGAAVGGWVFSPVGIREVSIWLDEERVGRAELGLERPDVARDRPELPGVERSGFRYRFDSIPSPPLPRTVELRVVAEDEEGQRTEVHQAVQAVERSLVPPRTGKGSSVRRVS